MTLRLLWFEYKRTAVKCGSVCYSNTSVHSSGCCLLCMGFFISQLRGECESRKEAKDQFFIISVTQFPGLLGRSPSHPCCCRPAKEIDEGEVLGLFKALNPKQVLTQLFAYCHLLPKGDHLWAFQMYLYLSTATFKSLSSNKKDENLFFHVSIGKLRI